MDTWFSSSLLPISALGWPQSEQNKKKPDSFGEGFYPLSIMETGADILFFWVARMAMICSYFTKQPPFKKILLHPMVSRLITKLRNFDDFQKIRDATGRKMSKSLGNVIDPLDVIEGISKEQMKANLAKSNISVHELNRHLPFAYSELINSFTKSHIKLRQRISFWLVFIQYYNSKT